MAGGKTSPEIIDNILLLHSNGYNNTQIAKELNISGKTAAKYLARSGYRSKYSSRHIKEEEENYIIELSKSGKNPVQIGQEVGRDSDTVRRCLDRNGIIWKKSLQIIDSSGLCNNCNQWKPILEFSRRTRSGNETYDTKCYPCKNTEDKERRSTLIGCLGSILNNKPKSDLTVNYLLDLYHIQNGKCFYTDELLGFPLLMGNMNSRISIDSVHNDKGYRIGNVVLCTFRTNRRKNDSTLFEIKRDMPGWWERIEKGYSLGILF